MGWLAARLGSTQGQAYTLVIAIALGLVLAMLGIPPALRDRPAARSDVVAPAPLPTPPPAPQPPAEGETITPFVPAAPAAGGSPVRPPAPREPGDAPAPAAERAAPFGTARVFAQARGTPEGVAVLADATVFVAANDGTKPSTVLRYDPEGSFLGAFVIQGQPQGRSVGVTGLAADTAGRLYVLDASTGRVLRIDPATGATREHARIPDVAPCVLTPPGAFCEPGAADRAPMPRDAAFDRAGRLYVSDPAQATIWRIPAAGGEPAAFHQALEYATGEGPSGVGFDDAGNLLFTVGSSLDTAPPGGAALYKLRIESSGAPGERVLITTFEADSAPSAVAVGRSGKVYVSLASTDAVVVLFGDGSESGRLGPEQARVRFDTPVAMSFAGTWMLVSNRGDDDPALAAVVAVAVEDEAARPG